MSSPMGPWPKDKENFTGCLYWSEFDTMDLERGFEDVSQHDC